MTVESGWGDLLDHLERDLADAELLVAAGAGPAYDGDAGEGSVGAVGATANGPWSPPVPPGPVPGHLVPRARDLARRQHDLRSRLAASLERLDRVQRLADDSDGDRRPRFVDVVG